MELYSVIKPATNSGSDSGKSNGILFVSANKAIIIPVILIELMKKNNSINRSLKKGAVNVISE